MRQVLTTIGTLAENDRAMLHAFVTQLAPDVLADVVLSQLANTDGALQLAEKVFSSAFLWPRPSG